MLDHGWELALASLGIPAIITALLTYFVRRGRVRVEAYMTDAEIARNLRDELREENDALRQRLDLLVERLDAVAAAERECFEARAILARLVEQQQQEIMGLNQRIARLERQVNGGRGSSSA